MIDIRDVDWNQVWKKERAARTSPAGDEEYWGERAASFAKAASETQFAEQFLAIMNPQAHWQVLDMACGGGTLAIPLARHVEKITAIDFSSSMLAILEGRCRDLGISNIKTIQGRWEDNWDALGIGRQDVAIASRSLASPDRRGALLKLDSIARERVYTVTTDGDGPCDRRIFEAIGRPLTPRPDYIYTYNLLYQMGIMAEVSFIHITANRRFAGLEEAFQSMLWMFDGLSLREEERLRSFLRTNLLCRDGQWTLSYNQVTRWAVIWWTKRELLEV